MPAVPTRARGNAFVVQKHWARSLHYDLRLQVSDRLASWAVPKGPSLDPSVRRLAIRVEDHPLSYLLFEGVLPEGQYGAGRVIVWDYGTYDLDRSKTPDIATALDAGDLGFSLRGRKLRGAWTMVRTQRPMEGRESWLWWKKRDEFAVPAYDPESEPESALPGRAPAPSPKPGRARARDAPARGTLESRIRPGRPDERGSPSPALPS